MTKTEIDWTKFTAQEDRRHEFSTPWAKSGHKYATDGRILIRMETDEPDSPDKRPECDGILTLPPGDPQPWPPPVYKAGISTIPCWHCAPTVETVQCSECGGTGEVECSECGQDTTCEECVGSGKIKDKVYPKDCAFCHGDGKVQQESIRIGDKHIARRYDEAIRSLPNPRYVGWVEHRLAFVFDGGVGAVMRLVVER